MPKKLEAALKRQAEKKGLTGERKNRFIYGAMRRLGWKPKGEK